jgi:hypothetical protein
MGKARPKVIKLSRKFSFSPNQGIKLSRKHSFATFLITLLTFGLTSGLIAGLMDGPDGHYDIWNNGRWSTIDGSNGFHADGYRWGKG